VLNVLIIDDEKWICELLIHSIDWESMDMRVVGDAINGLDAIERIMEADIALTDIRMPGMDGIELMRTARDKGWKGECIIISGYQDFEYAQKAMEYGVSQYILKPIDEDEIKISLIKLANKIKAQKNQSSIQHEISTKLEQTTETLRLETMKYIVKTGETPKKVELNYPNKYFQCAIIWPDYSSRIGDIDQIHESILDRLLSYVNKNIRDLIAYIEGAALVIIDNEDDVGDIVRILQVHMIELKYIVNNYPVSALTVGIGKPYESLKSVKSSYDEAVMSVRYRIVIGKGRIINFAEYETRRSRPLFTIKQKRQLVSMLQLEDFDAIHNWIAELFSQIHPESINPEILDQFVKEIVQTFYYTIEDLGFEVGCDAFKQAINEYQWLSTTDELKNWLTKKLVWEYHEYNEQRKSGEARPISLVREYIEKYYSDNVSLSDAAESVHMNPNYLSTLFKKVTGKSFVDYLTEYRIEMAKAFLKNGGIKINDIAGKVGYTNPGYFTKTFKRQVGISPQDFRKLYM